MTYENEEFVSKVRSLIVKNGKPMVPFEDRWDLVYGCTDWDALEHIRHDKCSWKVADGQMVEEQYHSEFMDTYSGNRETIGMEVGGASSACGKYTNIRLRWEATLPEALTAALNG